MSRTMLSTACLLLLLPSLAWAQKEPEPGPRPSAVLDGNDPLNGKELARAKFALAQATIQQREQARIRAARVGFEGRLLELLAGRGTQDFLFRSLHRLLAAELAVADTDVGRTAALESAWLVLRLIDDVDHARHDSGRVATKDWSEAQMARLDLEIRLARFGAERGHRVLRVPLPRDNSAPNDVLAAEVSEYLNSKYLNSKGLARQKFEALAADPKDLAAARLGPARQALHSRLGEWVAGRGTLDFTLGAVQRLRDVGLALANTESDRLAHLDAYWMTLRQIEVMNENRFHQSEEGVDGRVTAWDSLWIDVGGEG